MAPRKKNLDELKEIMEIDSYDKGLTAADQAYDYVISSLTNGSMQPGMRVRETELAEAIGISRTPIREALNRLVNEGLVSNDPRRGLIITELDQNMVGELYEMRRVLESTAASLAARHATDVEIFVLRTLMERDLTAQSTAEIAQNNKLFHQVLYKCAHNRYLLKTLQALQNSMLLLGESTLENKARAEDAQKEHEQIVAALEVRDPEKAAKMASDHISNAYKERLNKFLFNQ
ncbi:GntR family transcriptional regulator [Gallibacterium anatis]|uniref:GntR family transcriptional regulator n=1 Tax=Gallibacterium anatis TaxID=750 RepID=UPI00254DA7CC|nr:GntR family transcriptional regulator [Gallibacterium anatis]WIM81849.1 GntR family transcriptional regulator [Gallibacterium anatis]